MKYLDGRCTDEELYITFFNGYTLRCSGYYEEHPREFKLAVKKIKSSKLAALESGKSFDVQYPTENALIKYYQRAYLTREYPNQPEKILNMVKADPLVPTDLKETVLEFLAPAYVDKDDVPTKNLDRLKQAEADHAVSIFDALPLELKQQTMRILIDLMPLGQATRGSLVPVLQLFLKYAMNNDLNAYNTLKTQMQKLWSWNDFSGWQFVTPSGLVFTVLQTADEIRKLVGSNYNNPTFEKDTGSEFLENSFNNMDLSFAFSSQARKYISAYFDDPSNQESLEEKLEKDAFFPAERREELLELFQRARITSRLNLAAGRTRSVTPNKSTRELVYAREPGSAPSSRYDKEDDDRPQSLRDTASTLTANAIHLGIQKALRQKLDLERTTLDLERAVAAKQLREDQDSPEALALQRISDTAVDLAIAQVQVNINEEAAAQISKRLAKTAIQNAAAATPGKGSASASAKRTRKSSHLKSPQSRLKTKYVVVFDFDQCLMKEHWWGNYKDAPIETIEFAPDDFAHPQIKTLFTAIRSVPGVTIAVASFGRKDVIEKAIESVLGSNHGVYITTPRDYAGYKDGQSMGDKNTQLKNIAEHFGSNGKPLSLKNMIFFDDSDHNITSAKAIGVTAQIAAPYTENMDHLIFEFTNSQGVPGYDEAYRLLPDAPQTFLRKSPKGDTSAPRKRRGRKNPNPQKRPEPAIASATLPEPRKPDFLDSQSQEFKDAYSQVLDDIRKTEPTLALALDDENEDPDDSNGDDDGDGADDNPEAAQDALNAKISQDPSKPNDGFTEFTYGYVPDAAQASIAAVKEQEHIRSADRNAPLAKNQRVSAADAEQVEKLYQQVDDSTHYAEFSEAKATLIKILDDKFEVFIKDVDEIQSAQNRQNSAKSNTILSKFLSQPIVMTKEKIIRHIIGDLCNLANFAFTQPITSTDIAALTKQVKEDESRLIQSDYRIWTLTVMTRKSDGKIREKAKELLAAEDLIRNDLDKEFEDRQNELEVQTTSVEALKLLNETFKTPELLKQFILDYLPEINKLREFADSDTRDDALLDPLKYPVNQLTFNETQQHAYIEEKLAPNLEWFKTHAFGGQTVPSDEEIVPKIGLFALALPDDLPTNIENKTDLDRYEKEEISTALSYLNRNMTGSAWPGVLQAVIARIYPDIETYREANGRDSLSDDWKEKSDEILAAEKGFGFETTEGREQIENAVHRNKPQINEFGFEGKTDEEIIKMVAELAYTLPSDIRTDFTTSDATAKRKAFSAVNLTAKGNAKLKALIAHLLLYIQSYREKNGLAPLEDSEWTTMHAKQEQQEHDKAKQLKKKQEAADAKKEYDEFRFKNDLGDAFAAAVEPNIPFIKKNVLTQSSGVKEMEDEDIINLVAKFAYMLPEYIDPDDLNEKNRAQFKTDPHMKFALQALKLSRAKDWHVRAEKLITLLLEPIIQYRLHNAKEINQAVRWRERVQILEQERADEAARVAAETERRASQTADAKAQKNYELFLTAFQPPERSPAGYENFVRDITRTKLNLLGKKPEQPANAKMLSEWVLSGNPTLDSFRKLMKKTTYQTNNFKKIMQNLLTPFNELRRSNGLLDWEWPALGTLSPNGGLKRASAPQDELNRGNNDPNFELFRIDGDHRVFVRYKIGRDTEAISNACPFAVIMNMFMASLNPEQTDAMVKTIKTRGVIEVIKNAGGNITCKQIVNDVLKSETTSCDLRDAELVYLAEFIPKPGKTFKWRLDSEGTAMNLSEITKTTLGIETILHTDEKIQTALADSKLPSIPLAAQVPSDTGSKAGVNAHFVAAVLVQNRVHIIDNERSAEEGAPPFRTPFHQWSADRDPLQLIGIYEDEPAAEAAAEAGFVDACL